MLPPQVAISIEPRRANVYPVVNNLSEMHVVAENDDVVGYETRS